MAYSHGSSVYTPSGFKTHLGNVMSLNKFVVSTFKFYLRYVDTEYFLWTFYMILWKSAKHNTTKHAYHINYKTFYATTIVARTFVPGMH